MSRDQARRTIHAIVDAIAAASLTAFEDGLEAAACPKADRARLREAHSTHLAAWYLEQWRALEACLATCDESIH